MNAQETPSALSGKTATWAINPFEEETRPSAAAIEELRRWAESTGIQIRPVHVLFVSASDSGASGDQGSWVRRFTPAIESELASYVRQMDIPGMLAPKALVHHGVLTTSAVDALLKYAADVDAAWILVSSKGRSGLKRIALGSFAESLLARSPLPVWVFGHGASYELDPKHILFATDFSDSSNATFERVLEQASSLGARVTLCHCINLPEPMVSGAGVMGIASAFPIDEYLRDQRDWATLAANRLTQAGIRHNVRVGLELLELEPSVSNAIVQTARIKGAGIIALASSSGPIGSAILGSHARNIVRQSECPVWVFGPKYLASVAAHAGTQSLGVG